MSRHWNGEVRDGGTGRRGNPQAALDAAVLLRSPGWTPESVARALGQAAEAGWNVAVPAPRGSEDARQVTS